jgi:hypothetical protein
MVRSAEPRAGGEVRHRCSGAAETAELAEIESAILVALDESLRSADGRSAATVLTWIQLFDHLSEGCKFSSPALLLFLRAGKTEKSANIPSGNSLLV